jgi:PTS system nitrogen regulatory IIA component
MAEEDFDIAGLAAYLHIGPQQITRLAERGKLPGKRLGGEWRFSAAEIHHWLEDRIGLSDEAELAHVEGALERASGGDAATEVSIAAMLPLEAVAIPLLGKTRRSIIAEMVELAAATGYLWDPDKLAKAVTLRESMHPTALDNGVALLHPRRPLSSILAEPLIALGLSRHGVPFGSQRGRLTDIFFLICSCDDREHLRTLARLSRMINNEEFLALMRGCESAIELHELLRQREREIES